MSKCKFAKSYDIAVVFGGVSSENEVSVITGTMVCNVLKKGGKTVLPIYLDQAGNLSAGEALADVCAFKSEVKEKVPCGFCTGGVVVFSGNGKGRTVKVDCVINCCHGGSAEGGAVAGACELFGLPFASAGMFESAVFMDKYFTKLVLQSLGAKVAKFAYSRDIAGAISGAERLGYPVIVKPATLGSSIGVEVCRNREQLEKALNTAFALDFGVLIEEYLAPRKEINCAAYYADGEVKTSPCEEVTSAGDLLSYDDKYSGGGSRIFPADLKESVAEAIRSETQRVYAALNMRGIVRFDYIICNEKIYISEINTVPGSLSQYLLSDSYSAFYKTLTGVIGQALADFESKRSKKVVTTGILNEIKPSAKIK